MCLVVGVVDSLKDRLLLVTTADHGIHLCDPTTYSTKRYVDIGLGYIYAIAYIKDIRSAAIGAERGVALMEIID